MSDTVFRDEVKNAINATLAESIECEHSATEALTLLRHEIMALPSAEKTGRWVPIVSYTKDGREKTQWGCSECGQGMFQFGQRFCSNCGVRMEE